MPEEPAREPMTREEIAMAVHIAVLMELYKLRWTPWRKGMTVETVLKETGVGAFCEGVTERLVGIKPPVFYRPLPTLGHSADGRGVGRR
jgi:hypothetical protein